MAQKKSNSGGKAAAGFGAGLALAAAAAAGAYFLYGTKEGAKQRKKITGWSIKMKGEVLEKLETLKEINEQTYAQVVDTIGDKYKKVKSIDAGDVDKAIKELKGHWKSIKKHAEGSKRKKSRKTAKKTSRKKSSGKKR
jgi:muramidase (phage lysozyme)